MVEAGDFDENFFVLVFLGRIGELVVVYDTDSGVGIGVFVFEEDIEVVFFNFFFELDLIVAWS